MPGRVRIEEVIRTRVVWLTLRLTRRNAQHAGVEIEVFLRRPGDRRDVVQSVHA